jgi:protein-tyrosine kinase
MGVMFDALKKVERGEKPELINDSRKVEPANIVLDSKLVSYYEPSSMTAEQFRRLRAWIIKPGRDESIKTILVTSAMKGEGKSLIAINLAITVAVELHSNALLVDCDLRNPSLSRWFGFQEQKGLSNYLMGEAELPDLLVKTAINKLSILPGGSIQENPVELITSNKMKSLVQDLRARYDDRYIIIDSSPLLATTEPSVLNNMVDGIIFVIRAGVTPRESVQQALKVLDKQKILGVVLNSQEFKTQALTRRYFGTDRYYSHYEHYGYGSAPAPGKWGKISSLARDMKMYLKNIRSKKD